jgi:hypothetical protein
MFSYKYYLNTFTFTVNYFAQCCIIKVYIYRYRYIYVFIYIYRNCCCQQHINTHYKQMYPQVCITILILATNVFLMQSRQEYEQVTGKWLYWIYCTLCVIMIAVCWQDWTAIGEEFAVGMNKGCHDVGLRKQPLWYLDSWDFGISNLFYVFGYRMCWCS